MLPKKYRLTKREDFALIYAKGLYASANEGISIKYLANNQSVSKLGFPIGKNFSKKAVVRNRAKRVLRAASFQYLKTLKPGFDIVVMIRPGYQNIEFKKISEQLGRVFQKANLLM